MELEEDFLSFRELEEFVAIPLLEELDFAMVLLLDSSPELRMTFEELDFALL